MLEAKALEVRYGSAVALHGVDLRMDDHEMVALGRALMAQPDVLAVDELSLGLAPRIVRELVGHLRDFREASGMGLLLVEQNARLALEVCERAYVLESGRMAMSGPSRQIAQDNTVQRAYLGPQVEER